MLDLMPKRRERHMAQLRGKLNVPYFLKQKKELEARNTLLRRARKGDSQAQRALMDLYGLGVYAESEHKNTTVMDFLAQSSNSRRYKK